MLKDFTIGFLILLVLFLVIVIAAQADAITALKCEQGGQMQRYTTASGITFYKATGDRWVRGL